MSKITTIGLDIAKNSFFVHGMDAEGRAVVKKELKRGKVLEFFKDHEPCIAGREAFRGRAPLGTRDRQAWP